jgi:hypothetical protein
MDTTTMIAVGVGAVNVVALVAALTKIGALGKAVQRLSEQIPGTGMTAKELAGELGGSIESSFKQFMPQPEKVSGAITSAVESTMKGASSDLEGVRKSLAGLTEQLGKGLTAGSDQMKVSLTDGSKQMAEALTGATSKLETALTGTTAKLDAALKDHAAKAGEASAKLAAQLEKIASLEKDIEKLLHVQQATDQTLKSVAAADEFKSLISTLNKHLESSDQLLREAAKPRTIRLVEQDS